MCADPRCCLDSDFSVPLRRTYPDLDADNVPAAYNELIRALSTHLRCTNMALECLLSEIRQSIPYSKAKPLLEQLNYSGLLTQAKAK